MTPEERIIELEARFTLQERQLADLSDVLWKQQQTVDHLTKAVALLEQKLSGDPGLVDAHQHEKPPHY